MIRHFLDFKNSIGRIEISEPFGFDGSTHKLERNEFYGIDTILGDEEIELIVTRNHFEPITPTQQLPNGVEFEYASQGFDYFVDELNINGWEAEIEYILEKEGTEFSKGIVDGFTAVVEFEQVRFKVIQSTKREEVKRNLDVNINAFSDTDLEGNAIEPCQTVDILLKAKPINQTSKLSAPPNASGFVNGNVLAPAFFNQIKNIERSEIQDTVIWFNDFAIAPFPTTDYDNPLQDFKVLIAQNQLTNIKAKIKLNIKTEYVNSPTPNNVQVVGYLSKGNVDDTQSEFASKIFLGTEFYNTGVLNSSTPIYTRNNEIEYDLPSLQAGEVMYFVFSHAGGNTTVGSKTTFIDCSIEITATSTSINTVTKGIRYIDLVRHACKSVGIEPLEMPSYNVGGEHYDNFAFNGYLLGQVTDRPFNNTLKDLLAVTKELNHGYQINPDSIEVLHHDEFFKDVEVDSFIEIPNSFNKTEYNKDLFLKTFDYTYKNSSKGRETNGENSIDDVHGQTQWVYPSKKAPSNLKIELDHIRSAFLIEEQRRRLLEKESTRSFQGDDKLYLLKTVPNSPSSRGQFTASLQMQVSGSTLKILAVNFRWDLLGFQQGSLVAIFGEENVGNYFVQTIEPSVITLIGSGATFTGIATITFNYPLNNVLFSNQTSEGFTLIESLENPTNYSNLAYTIKRNLKKWYSVLASAGRYLSGEIKNTLFEVNGNLVTRLSTESENVVDNAPIDLEEIKEMRLYEPRLETVTVFCEFERATTLFEQLPIQKGYVTVNRVDGTIIKGFPKTMEYEWKSNQLEMVLMPKKESEFYEIDLNIVKSYQINNNIFVSLYDVNDVIIGVPLRFNKIKINGVAYTNVIDFANALTTVLDE